MFFLTYMLSELGRRSGRTVLTALGLGLGVGLVVTVNALSTGLDRAQAKILDPLIVGLLSAFLIASLLTLSSVTKRVRELGTLKALGWSQRLVVRQVTGESLIQGLLGGAVGVLIGIAGAVAITAFGPTLEATVESVAEQGPRFGPFGQGAVEPSATEVALDAPVSSSMALWAVGLALLGGLVAGAVGSLRASRLRPADALRHID